MSELLFDLKNETTMRSVEEQCRLAYKASGKLAGVLTKVKNAALESMSNAIIDRSDDILAANKIDIENGQKNGLPQSLIDRLALSKERLKGIADSILIIKSLKDPIGEILDGWVVENGLRIRKVRVPMGVVGMIYEARPNVTADAISLCLKTGNAVVLRGSSSAYESNKIIRDILVSAMETHGLPGNAFQLLDDTTRESVKTFITQNDTLSVVIPRGGSGLIQEVVKNATVPTIETGVGNCHVYIDKDADPSKIIPIVVNSKTRRVSVCNSCESLLIHNDVAQEWLPKINEALRDFNVEIRGCPTTCRILPSAVTATEADWATEYLDYILSVKVVNSTQDAIDHIATYGSHHTDAIISENKQAIQDFSTFIDSSAVIVNASTCFTDGGEFGFGGEIGISTQKLHARGPMGLSEITTYKYIVDGDGHIRP